MQLSIDEAEAFLDETAETFPAALFDELNGGVNLLEDTVPDPDFPPGEMYILGEYCNDMMGRYINLYFGSFPPWPNWKAGTGKPGKQNCAPPSPMN